MTFLPPDLLPFEETWDPRVFRGPVARLLADHGRVTVSELGGHVSEGLRRAGGVDANMSRSGTDAVVYRIGNVDALEFRLEGPLCVPPAQAAPQCVRPGDVVVTKGAPIRAALATDRLFRHPVDGNCFLIRGLKPGAGLWTALCLNQPAYAEYLVRRSGATVVPRVQAAVLRDAPLPAPPVEAESLAQRVCECLDRRIESTVARVAFVNRVRRFVESQVPDDVAAAVAMVPERGSWTSRFSSADVADSWAPGHVATSQLQRFLREQGRWRPVDTLLAGAYSGGSRVGQADESIPVLRLSDVRADYCVPARVSVEASDLARRVYAEPVMEGDVLASLLVTSPLVAFAGVRPEQPVRPVDHWARLRFRETPGAWALVLDSPPVHAQLRRSAIGSARQFVTPTMIRGLVLPEIPREVRVEWDEYLRGWQRERRDLDRQWLELLADCYRLLRRTHTIYGPWTEPPSELKLAGILT